MATLLRHLCFPSTATFSPEPFPSTSTPRSSNSFSLLSLPLSTSSPSFSSLSHRIHNRSRRQYNPFLAFSSSAIETPQLDLGSPQDAAVEEPAEEEFSETRLVAQNVPWTCTTEDIRSLFEKYGTVLEVEFSMYNKTRNRGLAFVEMGSPEEAAEALKNLESSEFEGRTLKINYAKPQKEKTYPPKRKPVTTFNIFVANMPYDARAKDLKQFFAAENSSVVSAEIVFHDNPRRSSGYGFVAFKTKKEAEAAVTAFQAKTFMGRPIRVALSKQFVKVQTKENLQSTDTPIEEETNAAEASAATG